jgi:hypothetical protein
MTATYQGNRLANKMRNVFIPLMVVLLFMLLSRKSAWAMPASD